MVWVPSYFFHALIKKRGGGKLAWCRPPRPSTRGEAKRATEARRLLVIFVNIV